MKFNVIHHVNKGPKNKTPWPYQQTEKKEVSKIQHPVMRKKKVQQNRKKRDLNHDKGTYKQFSTDSRIVKDWMLSPELGNNTVPTTFTLTTPIQHYTGNLDSTTRKEKQRKSIYIVKKQVNLSLFEDDIILYTKKSSGLH